MSSDSCCTSPLGGVPAISSGEVVANLVHKLSHRAAAMVAGHVGVQLPPDAALDAVVVRAVRRQEMQHDPAAEVEERRLHRPATVDGVIIQDDVDHPFALV